MRLARTTPLLLLGMTAPLAAQTSQSADRAAVRRSIDAGNAAYIAAFKRADAKALSRVYDPQGARLNDSGVVVRGRNAIVAAGRSGRTWGSRGRRRPPSRS